MTPKRRKAPETPEAETPELLEEPRDIEESAAEESKDLEELEADQERREEEIAPPENIVEERIYTVPLQDAWKVPRWRRTPKAMKVLRGFILRHMKPETIKLTPELNERLWYRGMENPPRRIRVRAVKDDEGEVTVYLHEGGK